MNIPIIIITFILVEACTSKVSIDVNSIQIVRFNQHPWFVDHERKLITFDRKGDIIDETKLYPDSGNGCNSYLFDYNNNYVLIDCNGQWFTIDKSSGALDKDKWEWRKALPSVQLGVFERQDNEAKYKLSTTTKKLSEKEVYKYKDPYE